ncbi:MAG: VTT domain-containing protein [Candidatus Hodarchaeota archaeon]
MAQEHSVASDEDSLKNRAGDAKFYLFWGSGAFFLLGVLFLLPVFLPLILLINIQNALLLTGLGYLIPGFVLFLWGLVKVFRGKDLTFSQVWQAQIQRSDVKRTLRFLLFVSFFIILLVIPVLIGLSIVDLMNGVIDWAFITFGPVGIYLGIFLVSIFGNFTVIFPVPYLFVLLWLVIGWPGGITLVDGLLLGFVVGAGAAIGETTAWLLGRTQTGSLEESSTGRRILKLREQIERGFGGLLIFLYAASPLPDDILLIALGATKYPLWKALLYSFLGKVTLALIITLGALQPLIQPILVQIFGGVSDPVSDTAYLILGIALIGLFFIPWGSLLQKLRRRSPELE